MNGPTIGTLVFMLGVGGFMLIAWYRPDSPRGPHGTRRQRQFRAVNVLVWLSAVIMILVFANDQPKPWLTAYILLAWGLSLHQGMRDLKARKDPGMASSDTV